MDIDQWLEGFKGLDIREGVYLSKGDIDAMSGASISSKAIIDIINKSGYNAGKDILHLNFSHNIYKGGRGLKEILLDYRIVVTFVVFLTFIPVYLTGSKGWRLVYLGLSLLTLGWLLNLPFTMVDLGNISRGHIPGLQQLMWFIPVIFILIFGVFGILPRKKIF